MLSFWDRCRYVGQANGAALWRCPKSSSRDRREFDCLFEGLEMVEDAHTFWVLTPFQGIRKTIDRISDTIIGEGSTKPDD